MATAPMARDARKGSITTIREITGWEPPILARIWFPWTALEIEIFGFLDFGDVLQLDTTLVDPARRECYSIGSKPCKS